MGKAAATEAEKAEEAVGGVRPGLGPVEEDGSSAVSDGAALAEEGGAATAEEDGAVLAEDGDAANPADGGSAAQDGASAPGAPPEPSAVTTVLPATGGEDPAVVVGVGAILFMLCAGAGSWRLWRS
jgi:hypothetical protein